MLHVSIILLPGKRHKHHERCQREALSVLMQQWAVTGFFECHVVGILCYKMEYESSEKLRGYSE